MQLRSQAARRKRPERRERSRLAKLDERRRGRLEAGSGTASCWWRSEARERSGILDRRCGGSRQQGGRHGDGFWRSERSADLGPSESEIAKAWQSRVANSDSSEFQRARPFARMLAIRVLWTEGPTLAATCCHVCIQRERFRSQAKSKLAFSPAFGFCRAPSQNGERKSEIFEVDFRQKSKPRKNSISDAEPSCEASRSRFAIFANSAEQTSRPRSATEVPQSRLRDEDGARRLWSQRKPSQG